MTLHTHHPATLSKAEAQEFMGPVANSAAAGRFEKWLGHAASLRKNEIQGGEWLGAITLAERAALIWREWLDDNSGAPVNTTQQR